MGRTHAILMFGVLAAVTALGYGCGSSTANAVPPTVLNAGVSKNILVNLQTGGGYAIYDNNTSAITINGNMVSFEDSSSGVPKQVVYIGYPMIQIYEN